MPMTDEQIADVYTEHRPHVVRWLAARMSGDVETAEDIYQDTMLRLISAAIQPDQSNARKWLFATAGRICIDRWRRSTKIRMVHYDQIETCPSRVDMADAITTSIDVQSAYSRMPRPYQRSMLLAYHCGYRLAEVGAIEGETVPAIKTRLWRARGAMQQALAR